MQTIRKVGVDDSPSTDEKLKQADLSPVLTTFRIHETLVRGVSKSSTVKDNELAKILNYTKISNYLT